MNNLHRRLPPAALAFFAAAVAALLFAHGAAADPVLVEFTAADGSSLVPAGDLPEPCAPWSGEAAAKRVHARALAIAAAREALVAALPAPLAAKMTGSYANLPFLAMDVEAGDRLLLLAQPQVAAVHDDARRRLLTRSSLAYIGARGWHEEGFTGEGTSVAILDSGVRYWNGFFGSCEHAGDPGCRVLAFESFSTLRWGTGTTDPVEVATISGHGTNVAGIVGDVAPAAGLLSLCVFAVYDPDPSTGFEGGVLANDGDIAEAIDWVIGHRADSNIVSANLSLGSDVDPELTGFCGGSMAGAYPTAFALLRAAGVLPVVATGNDYVKTSVGPPSCVATAVRVGAGYDDPAYGYPCGTGPVVPGAVTCFSNSSSLVDLVAPGNDIDAGGLEGYSGTSMATPHVAGLVALYAARYMEPPLWTFERMRADAVPVREIGPRQDFVHRYVRVGDRDALLSFSTGAILASTFEGVWIPDGDAEGGLEVSGEIACDGDACGSGRVGKAYLDLTVDHPGTGDLVVELTAPDGTTARRAVDGDEELGVANVNSILGSQHLPGAFDALGASPIAGTWTLRVLDDTTGRRGKLSRAVLLVDPARVEVVARVKAPAIGRPGEPFTVKVDVENRGNLEVTEAALVLRLVEKGSGRVVDEAAVETALPFAPGGKASKELALAGPQGSYVVRVDADALAPDVVPGFRCEPAAQDLDITYRTFAAFTVEPPRPVVGQEARLTATGRGIVQSWSWDFGDGEAAGASAPAHAWQAAGTYEVTLTVTGPEGASTTAQRIAVEAPVELPPPPVVHARGGGCDCAVAPGPDAGGGAAPAAILLILGALVVARGGARRRGAAALLAAWAALCAAGCGEETTSRDAPAEDAAAEEEEAPPPMPWVSLLDPPDPSTGDVTVYVLVGGDAGDACDVELTYRTPGGEKRAATLASPAAARGVSPAPDGKELGLVWRSAVDVTGDVEGVRLEARAACRAESTLAVESSLFTLLNFFAAHPGAVLFTEVSVAEQNVPGESRSDYVEIVNNTGEAIALDGWRFLASSGSGEWKELPLDGLALDPWGRLVVAEKDGEVPGAAALPEEVLWNLERGGAVALFDDRARGVDFVRWGGSPAEAPEGLAWTDEPPLPVPQTLTVLNRIQESGDTDRSRDFCIGRPSPGGAPAGCLSRTPPGGVLVSELSTQGTSDMVELLNASGGPVDTAGWAILWDGDELGAGVVPLAAHVVEAGARLVLKDNGTAGRVSNGVMELGENLNIDGLIPVAVAMRSPYGDIVDFLAAGGSTIRWMDWEGDAPTPMPGPRTTLSRRPGDPDTDSSADFCLTAPNLRGGAAACLAPLDLPLTIAEVNTGRPDWIEIYNGGSAAVDLSNVYLSYTASFYGGSVGDYLLRGTLLPGERVVVADGEVAGVTGVIMTGENVALAPEGAGSVALRDLSGFGIDFVKWGDPAGTPLWPDAWSGIGADLHDQSDTVSIQRRDETAADTDTRDDWCWSAAPSPKAPNNPCEG